MKHVFRILLPALALLIAAPRAAKAQIDPALLRRRAPDTTGLKLNLDAVYNRPFLEMGRLPVALGGYAEANYQYAGTDGVSEGHQFQARRLTLFVSSGIGRRLKFLTEIEFEDGTKEINIEFASLDVEFSPLLNFRGGIVLNPIGAFNQNHDGPKWEFVDRPIAATQLLPATWSNVGVGVFGKRTARGWAFAYEGYLTNGFDDRVVLNTENRTFLPASKLNPNRFEENANGQLLATTKVALRRQKVGEIGLSWMGGVYNKFQDDGLTLDRKRRLDVWAVDANTTLPGRYGPTLVGEWAWVRVDVPESYSPQYGEHQTGGFLDVVQPIWRGNLGGFPHSVINFAVRFEYVDWNRDRFPETGGRIGDNLTAIVPALSWRPSAQTVVRANYRIGRQRDFLGNPPAKSAAVQVGFSTYF
jgi:hypothetical protein